MVLAPTVKLNNGHEMPAFGLGTSASIGGDCLRAVRDAIDAGYRHFDCAYKYGNESEVGQAIREKIAEGVVKRAEIFYVSKLWSTFHRGADVERAFRRSLANCGLEYIDLYLIHIPVAFAKHEANENVEWWPRRPDGLLDVDDELDYLATWRELEKLVAVGWVRSIGLSNFNSVQIERVLAGATVKPVVNEVECSPTFNQRQLIAFCKARDIVVTAYCPLGRLNAAVRTPAFVFDATVQRIAEKHRKTAVQIVLRYVTQLGAVPIPKSVTKKRIEENIDIFDFALSEDDVKVLDAFHTGIRVIDFDAKHSIHYPFAIPF